MALYSEYSYYNNNNPFVFAVQKHSLKYQESCYFIAVYLRLALFIDKPPVNNTNL